MHLLQCCIDKHFENGFWKRLVFKFFVFLNCHLFFFSCAFHVCVRELFNIKVEDVSVVSTHVQTISTVSISVQTTDNSTSISSNQNQSHQSAKFDFPPSYEVVTIKLPSYEEAMKWQNSHGNLDQNLQNV